MITPEQQQKVNEWKKKNEISDAVQPVGWYDRVQQKVAQMPPPEPSMISKVASKSFDIAKKYIVPSEVGFGESIAGAIIPHTRAFKDMKKSQQGLSDMQTRLITAIRERRSMGEDVTHMVQTLKESGFNAEDERINPVLNKSNKQIIGEALGTTIDIAAFGTYGAVKGAVLTAKTTFEAMKQGFIRGAVRGAPIGAGFGLSSALQEDEDIGGIIKRTLISGAFGGVVGGGLEAIVGRKQLDPNVLRQQAIAQYKRGLAATKEKYKERADKVIPQFLDKEWWGTRKQLLKKADEGLRLTGDEYEKLGELKGVLDTKGLVNQIEKEIEGLGNFVLDPDTGERIFRPYSVNAQKVKALQELRGDVLATQAYEGLQKGTSAQQELRELAQSYGKELYETRKSLKTISDNKTLSQVKKVDSAIRGLLNTANQKYEQINNIYHLNSELYDILNETRERTSGHPPFGLRRVVEALSTIGVAASGIVHGVPGVVGGLLLGIAGSSMIEIANSTWWNTWRAVQKSRLADRLLTMGLQDQTRWLRIIANEGIKVANELIGESGDNSEHDNTDNKPE